MAQVTLQLLEGLERGLIFRKLNTPVTIGREDENSVRLNDERVSRFHAKIQEDGGKLILTDLESTNGTRINGHPIQMRVLQIGDQIAIGRCLLVYGSPEEIRSRLSQLLAEGRGQSESTADVMPTNGATQLALTPTMMAPASAAPGRTGPRSVIPTICRSTCSPTVPPSRRTACGPCNERKFLTCWVIATNRSAEFCTAQSKSRGTTP
jgi:pSer/pThr/pTyr-binding forkhead associated (FHA) protein